MFSNPWKRLVLKTGLGLALYLLVLTLIALSISGCSSYRVEYEHVSHPFAGQPFGPASEEDTLDQLQVCAKRSAGRAYTEACLGYRLTDGGFYGPPLTGGIRIGVELGKRP